MPRGVYKYGKRSLPDRFGEKVCIGGTDECWPFLGCKDKDGRGQIANETGRLEHAHRVAYRLSKGPIPAGLLICHSCDNPPCCNQAHLWPGTYKDNSQDAERKGRLYNHFPKYGAEHPSTKISAETRAMIASDRRSHRAVALAFGISKTHVTRIKREADTVGGNW